MSAGAKLFVAFVAAFAVAVVIASASFAAADLVDRAGQPCPPGTATTYDVAGYRSGCVGPFAPAAQ